MKKRQRKKVRNTTSRSIKGLAVRHLDQSWKFARYIRLPLNRFVSIRPHDINEMPKQHRHLIWEKWRNSLQQFARDNGFEYACIWSRESDPEAGSDEHLHVLLHIPKKHQKQFDRLMEKWSRKAEPRSMKKRRANKPDPFIEDEDRSGSVGGCGGGDNEVVAVNQIDRRHYGEVVHCEPADYKARYEDGKRNDFLTYLTKNSPQAAYSGRRSYRRGGPIEGQRTGTSRNLSASARRKHGWAEVKAFKQRSAEGSRPTCHLHKVEKKLNYPAIEAEVPVVTVETAHKKIAGNSNFPEKFERGEVA